MISVSIVLYNNTIKEVETCLNSFITSPLISEVIICDNSENPILTGESLEYISNKVIYVSNPSNPGYGAGHNLAYKSRCHKAKYHVVMNLDVTVNQDTFSLLLRKLESDSNIVHAMPKVLNPDGTIQRLCKKLPSPVDLFVRRFIPSKTVQTIINNNYVISNYMYDKDLNAPYLSGCFMFLRSEAFEEIGMFDESFFMYPEDIDLTRRMHEIGETICAPEVSIIHQHGKASYKSAKMTKIHVFGMIKYFNKWGWVLDKKRFTYNRNLTKRIK